MKEKWVLVSAISTTLLCLLVIIAVVIFRFIEKTDAFTPIVIYNHTSPTPKPIPEQEPSTDKPKNVVVDEDVPTDEKDEIATPSVQTKPFTFTVLADSDNYDTSSGHNDVLEKMLGVSKKLSPDFALFSGDLITMPEPSTARVSALKKLIEKYYDKYYIAFGKHDVECGTACVDTWQKTFFGQSAQSEKRRELYHSFDHENTHFVLLSSDYPLKHGVDDAQLKWLNDDLQRTDKEHIIVVSHVPPVNFYKESTKECHDMTCDETRRARLQSILTAHHVDLVISGHEHAFDHKIVDNTHYVIAGNIGNGKRYKDTLWQNSFLQISVNASHITLKLFDENGSLLQEKQIR